MPYPITQRAIQQGVRSICFVPLITPRDPLGVLVLSSNIDHAFGREQVQVLEPAAAAIAQVVGNAQAHRDLQQKKSRLQALRDIDDALLPAAWTCTKCFLLFQSACSRRCLTTM